MRQTDKHQKILTAAIKIFGEKGFFNARISDIAKEAKVADGTIYLYFNNKHDILLTLFDEEIGKLILQIRDAIKREADPHRMLKIFAHSHLQLVIDKKELAGVLQMELRQSNQPMKKYRNTKFAEYVNIISEIIHLGQEKAVFRTDLMVGIAKRAFFGALDEISRLWILDPEHGYSVEETVEQVTDMFLDGINIKMAVLENS